MSNRYRAYIGLIITLGIFLLATFINVKTNLNVKYLPSFLVTLSIEILLSAFVIIVFKKYIAFQIAVPPLKKLIKPIAFALVATIVINVAFNIVAMLLGQKIEIPKTLSTLTPWQVIVFVFFYASIAEELLFRGFLLNFLKPLQAKNIAFFKRKISLPVIISAIAFGLAHLVLLYTDISALFICRIIIFTTCLGLIAGYYQEKYNNHSYAVLVHMAGNSLAVIAAFVMH